MTEADVIELLDCLKEAGVDVCIDGGWGVDALVGKQTREHGDLDLAVDRDELDNAQRALAKRGFHHDATLEPGLPARLVLRDDCGRQVDLHPLAFDERGDGWQQLSESGKAWGLYPAGDLDASGAIAGRRVRCLSPELQLRFHLGYEWKECDERDLRLLTERFGVASPPRL
jgi:lincosamide nucleotidyltransferase A/C/D/E